MHETTTLNTNLLDQINDPKDLKKLSLQNLNQLAQELREFILQSVSQTGGHLSSNLGTVELTIAIHYIFNMPNDTLVWDVGHQSYPHKILTGRKHLMHTLRKFEGLSGFPKRSESIYDSFGTAHSSTSISASFGMAKAANLLNLDNINIAVIGDGAMSAGMVFEALNNAGIDKDAKLLVILNDNDMSISPAVGAFNKYLARLMSGKFYAATKKNIGKVLNVAPPVKEFAKKIEEHTKGMITPATLFEEFGFNYIGPIDGHDLPTLVSTLKNIQYLLNNQHGPQFLHIVTKKGQGYKMAELDPILYHGPGQFNPSVGIVPANTPSKKTYTQVFSDWICDMAEQDERLVAITPAMREGSGLIEFEKRFPTRYFDVGIAEQHAATFAAGIACQNLKPVLAIYSTFLQRAYDQLVHDIALQNLPVLFAIDRAGLVGADGATHAGNYDIAYMRCIPNMAILTPSNENECRQLLYTAYQQNGPAAVRYPRGTGIGAPIEQTMQAHAWGKANIIQTGTSVAILAFGPILNYLQHMLSKHTEQFQAIWGNIKPTIVDMRFVKPLDSQCIQTLNQNHDYFITIEDSCIMGGAGSACLEAMQTLGIYKPTLLLGLPDVFIDQGDVNQLWQTHGLDLQTILDKIKKLINP